MMSPYLMRKTILSQTSRVAPCFVRSRCFPHGCSLHQLTSVSQPRFPNHAPRLVRTTSTSTRPDQETLFFDTSHYWVCNNDIHLKKTYTPFNVDALEQIACRAVNAQRCLSWDKLGEGSYNKVFLLRFDNNASVAIRIPCPIVANIEKTVQSEVATMCYIRDRWAHTKIATSIPLPPKVIAWDASYNNPAGTPYIIAEYAEGVVLDARWDHIQGDDVLASLISIRRMEITLMCEPFSQIGSLFFAEDVPEHLRDRPLYPTEPPENLRARRGTTYPIAHKKDGFEWSDLEASEELKEFLSSKYRIGPTVDRAFWRPPYGSIEANRGPWPDMQTMMRSAAELQLRALDSGAVDVTSSLVTSTPADVPLLRRMLNICINIAPSVVPRDPPLTMPVLTHPDASLKNLIVLPEGPATVQHAIDWQHACVESFLMVIGLPKGVISPQTVVPVPLDLSEPPWPEDMDELPEEIQEFVRLHHRYACRHRLYAVMRWRDDLCSDAMDVPWVQPLVNTFYCITRCIADGPRDLRNNLLQLREHWPTIDPSGGPCPIDFSEAEIAAFRAEDEVYLEYARNVSELYADVGCDQEGSVRVSHYQRAKEVIEQRRTEWDEAQMKGPFPIFEGAPTNFLN